ncbi:MAG TPA: DUF1592 domain-containing protein [Polyangiaceae bacterium]|nr:DUF1592 domain-containing protein [Polyangiaceae bacterium]
MGSTRDLTAGSAGIGTIAGGGGSSAGGGALLDSGLPGRALVRRLSNAEYDATIVSLFGDKTGYAAAFPTDTVVNGFSNNTDVQDVPPALAEQYMVVSEQIAANATKNTDTLLGCKLSAGETCINDFISRFGLRAWRRPITAVEQTDLLSVYRSGADSATGVRLLLEAFLVSPSFLYRVEVGVPVPGQTYRALTSWEIASRLSYFLTGTMPDDQLLARAQADGLSTAEGIASEAKRIIATPAARAQVAAFFGGWLDLRAMDRLERDTQQFPKWDSRLPALLASETKTFATHVVFDGDGDLKTLLTAPFTYGDPSLAAYYGGTVTSMDNGVARIALPPSQRAGLLTQAAFLAAHAKEIATDPVSRGKFVRERIFCQGLPPPPPELVIAAPEITPGTTTRERFKQHESEALCAGCHKLIDPMGLAFENFDAIGQWREQEQGQPIDVSGELTNTDVTGAFVGVVPMTAKLAQSKQVATCFVRQWFRFAFGRAESDSDDPRIGTIASGFETDKGKVLDLLIDLTTTPDFRYLAAETK